MSLPSQTLSFFFWGVVTVFWCHPFSLFSQQVVNPQRLAEVEKLVVREPLDYGGASLTAQEAADLKLSEQLRMRSIQAEPDLTPYLIVLANQYFNESNFGLYSVMKVLEGRSDLRPETVDRLVEQANALLNTWIPDRRRSISEAFLTGVGSILGNHPSPSHEEYLIRMLSYRDDIQGADLKIVAIQALGKSGTRRAVPAMVKAVDWLRQFAVAVDDPALFADARRAEASLAQLRHRVEPPPSAAPSPSPSPAAVTPLPTQAQKPAGP